MGTEALQDDNLLPPISNIEALQEKPLSPISNIEALKNNPFPAISSTEALQANTQLESSMATHQPLMESQKKVDNYEHNNDEKPVLADQHDNATLWASFNSMENNTWVNVAGPFLISPLSNESPDILSTEPLPPISNITQRNSTADIAHEASSKYVDLYNSKEVVKDVMGPDAILHTH